MSDASGTGSPLTWDDERVELLKKLWTDGLSASQIAAELGGVTRNAVIGKVHRLGLSGRAKPNASASPVARKAPVRGPSHPLQHSAAQKNTSSAGSFSPAPMTHGANALAPDLETFIEPAAEAPPAPSQDVVIPFSERVTIMELKESMCRWPMGDPTKPDFRFCGAPSSSGAPYCQHHCKIAYQPVSDRRRKTA